MQPILTVETSAAPVREQVARVLRNAIVTGHFKPGERLTERRLCELTDVSRTSIREALRSLESEGLVTMVPHRGPIVAVLTIEEARDVYQLRAMLEGYAMELFTQRATDEQVGELQRSVERIFELRDGDVDELLQAKDDFYAVLAAGINSPMTTSMLTSLQDRSRLLRWRNLAHIGRAEAMLVEFRVVIDAVAARDATLARDGMIEHIRNAEAVALSMLQDPASTSTS